jgi:cation diffusion facilitator CzcD-associated flavoprotein CzcO
MTGFGLRRVPMETHYYEAYNRPNVRLIDILETPIEHIKEDGVKTSQEYVKLDTIIYATGFSASEYQKMCARGIRLIWFTVTGAFEAIDFRGNDDTLLVDQWRDGPRTYLGLYVFTSGSVDCSTVT